MMFNFKKMTFLLSLTLIIQSGFAFAEDIHLNIQEHANKVLVAPEGALTVDQVKEIVAGDHINVKIAYERLLQAQSSISVARAKYFPYGVGSVYTLSTAGSLSPLILVELITSLPSKWYTVKKEKNLKSAQKYNFLSLRENIKNQVASIYYNYLREKTYIDMTALQLTLTEKLLETAQIRVDIGLEDADKLSELKLRVLDLRDIYLKYSGYLNEEQAAINMMLNLTPEAGAGVKFAPVAPFLSGADYQMSVDEMLLGTVENSYEVKAANYMVKAAYNSKRSTQWSILSFSGLGFGYWARVQFSQSKIEEATVLRELTRENVVNQIYTKDTIFQNSLKFYESEQEIYSETKYFMEGNLDLFNSNDLELAELLESEILYLKDFSEMLAAHYDSLVNLDGLERAVLKSVSTKTQE